jgi:hypothetical protein
MIVEYLWDCASCGRKRILGRHTKCPDCAASVPRNGLKDPYYDPGPGAPAVEDPEMLRLAMAGVNLACPCCDAIYRQTDAQCPSCGAERAEGAGFRLDSSGVAPMPQESVSRRWRWAAAGALVTIGLVGFLVWGFSTHPVPGRVVDKAWTRSETVQSWGRSSASGWLKDLVPEQHADPLEGTGEAAGVENIRNCRQEVSGSHRIVSGHHEQCTMLFLLVPSAEAGSHGNGFGSHPSSLPSFHSTSHPSSASHPSSTSHPAVHVPHCTTVTDYTTVYDYDTRCDYDTWVWTDGNTYTETGSADRARVWPVVTIGDLQRARQAESDTVTVTYDDARYTWAIDASAYNEWNVGDAVTVHVCNFGGVTAVEHR